MSRKILIAFGILAAVLAVLCVVISLQPATFTVERSAVITAPPAAVFAQVNDLRAWDAWSPWKELDPHPKVTLSDPSAGKGATFAWSGNEKIGEGTLTIVESRPDDRVELEQAFVRPLPGKARMTFTFEPAEGGTRVTWTMTGANDFIGKAMCLVMDMDAMVGGSFEKGLAGMKTVVETGSAAPGPSGP